MFKCEVIGVRYYLNIKETQVIYRVSDKGNSRTSNHKLTGKPGNCSFIIGEIDRSIKKGDLIRCDGLPFMAKPTPFPRTKKIYQTSSTYLPFQLDSGYWVLRKK